MTNSGFNVYHFPSPQLLADAAARDWSKRIANAKAPFTVALSGGRIANEFFRQIVVQTGGNVGIRHAHFFWADERCVPQDHGDSNYRVARELLFEPLQIEASRIHRIRGEDEPPRAAAAASQELLRVAPLKATQTPILDWIFLGMGEDGHVASLFPGATPYRGVYYDVIGPKPPPERITLSYDVLAAAGEVWVLASGLGKEAALRESLRPGGTTPLGQVLKMREKTEIFSDIPAKIP
jgi:6-phosphogluconolactonase